MKIPRRKFLHLPADAVALTTVSRSWARLHEGSFCEPATELRAADYHALEQ